MVKVYQIGQMQDDIWVENLINKMLLDGYNLIFMTDKFIVFSEKQKQKKNA